MSVQSIQCLIHKSVTLSRPLWVTLHDFLESNLTFVLIYMKGSHLIAFLRAQGDVMCSTDGRKKRESGFYKNFRRTRLTDLLLCYLQNVFTVQYQTVQACFHENDQCTLHLIHLLITLDLRSRLIL